ncbi:MAG: class A beta-lactamase-related serine hydrolase [Candidatus Bathyarchaeota archaeon]|nr:class A beta-lactamase-related serine hydrolase [Candidatus Bathyarchaeota archaeon]
MTLFEVLVKEASGFGKTLGVAVKHLGTGESAAVNGDERYPTASVFKVPVIVELFNRVESGMIDLDERVMLIEDAKVPGSGILKELEEGLEVTFRDLTRMMMILSDNTATDMILERVGLENVNQRMRDLGLKHTVIVGGCRDLLFDLVGGNDLPAAKRTVITWDEMAKNGANKGTWSLDIEHNNVTTPNEMNQLLKLLVNGQAASPSSCVEILSIMDKCQTGEYRIPKYLPTDKVKMTRKTGSLPGIRNDTGIITIKDTGEQYTISCFTKGATDVYSAEEAIAKTSKAVYDYFTNKN